MRVRRLPVVRAVLHPLPVSRGRFASRSPDRGGRTTFGLHFPQDQFFATLVRVALRLPTLRAVSTAETVPGMLFVSSLPLEETQTGSSSGTGRRSCASMRLSGTPYGVSRPHSISFADLLISSLRKVSLDQQPVRDRWWPRRMRPRRVCEQEPCRTHGDSPGLHRSSCPTASRQHGRANLRLVRSATGPCNRCARLVGRCEKSRVVTAQ